MIKTAIGFLAGNILSGVVYFMQIKANASVDQTSVLYTVIGVLSSGLVAMYFLQRKDQKERETKDLTREKKDEEHANTIKNIYDTVVKEVNTTINNNSSQTKDLKEAINQLPEKLRNALK